MEGRKCVNPISGKCFEKTKGKEEVMSVDKEYITLRYVIRAAKKMGENVCVAKKLC